MSNTKLRPGLVLVAIATLVLTVLALATMPAAAQSALSGSASSAESNVNVETGAYSYNGGTTFEESPPALGGLALGGGHPCAYAPATLQVTAIGGGFGGGGMKIDSACMLMVMGAAGDAQAARAAEYIIAARDPLACQAMKAAGMVTDCLTRQGKPLRPRPSPALAASSRGAVEGYGAKCEKVGNRITFRATSASAKAAELANCKAFFGY